MVYTYCDKEDGNYTSTVPSTIGTWYVKATVPDTDNYAGGEAVGSFSIVKAKSVAATVTTNSRIYAETEKALVTVTGEASGGTMQYALGTNSETATESGWSAEIPTATDIGTYYVWYKVVGDENHDDSVAVCVMVSIATVYGTPTFTIPSGLTTIEESAFEGMTAMTIVDASNVTSIDKWAFKNSGTTQIKLPKDCDIDADAFSECGTVYVYAPVGGKTQTSCGQISNLIFVGA